MLLLVPAAETAVAWWRDPASVGGWRRLWVAALPLLVVVHLRYFSVLACPPDPDTCKLDDRAQEKRPRT